MLHHPVDRAGPPAAHHEQDELQWLPANLLPGDRAEHALLGAEGDRWVHRHGPQLRVGEQRAQGCEVALP